MSKLGDWLETSNMKRTAFAEAIGVRPSYVTLLCSDKPAWPGRKIAGRIRDVTGGAVTADDFLPPAAKDGAVAEAAA